MSGICKHVGALLWYIEREVRLGNNRTCTSKKQKWSVPSWKQLKLHGPELLNNIIVKKTKAERVLSGSETFLLKRYEFYPRPLQDRSATVLLENDVDKLADVTNGNCGIVMLMRRKRKGNDECRDIAQIVEIESSKHIEQPLTIKQTFETYGKCSFNDFVDQLNVTVDQQNIIQEQKAKQSSENSWFEYRVTELLHLSLKTL